MNEDIIRMAREAGYQHPDAVGTCEDFSYFSLERFAALVRADEREACARFVEEKYERQFERPWREDLAAAIRARGDK